MKFERLFNLDVLSDSLLKRISHQCDGNINIEFSYFIENTLNFFENRNSFLTKFMETTQVSTTPIKEQSEWKFQLTRIYTIVCLNVLYALVSFQKQCPSVVAEDMAQAYKVTTKELGVFSSVYFYPYAFTQPFAGLLADVVDPALVVGCSCLVAGAGSIIIGFSKSLGLGIFGRLLVGLGCGPTYVSTCRVITSWFKLSQVPAVYGILVASAGIGGILAAAPLALFIEKAGWQAAFWGIGGIGCIISIIVLLFVRGNPMNKGFKAVNEELASPTTAMPIKQKLTMLWINFKGAHERIM